MIEEAFHHASNWATGITIPQAMVVGIMVAVPAVGTWAVIKYKELLRPIDEYLNSIEPQKLRSKPKRKVSSHPSP